MIESIWIVLADNSVRERIICVADTYSVASKAAEKYSKARVEEDLTITLMNHMVCTEDTWEDFIDSR